MNNQKYPDSLELRIQETMNRFLKTRYNNDYNTTEDHLDDDTLAAFVEGNLGEKQAVPVVRHLVGCSFCRHITAELIKLDLVFAEENFESKTANEKPAKISDVLSSVVSKIFGGNDGAVFAHQETEDEDEKTETSSNNTDDKHNTKSKD